MLRVLVLLLLAISACGNDGEPAGSSSSSPGDVTVSETQTAVVVASGSARATIDKATVNLVLNDASGGLLTSSSTAPILIGSDGSADPVLRVVSTTPLERDGVLRGVTLDCSTSQQTVSVDAEFLTPRAFVVRLRPANASGVARVQTRLNAQPDEHYYGLMERIVDAPTGDIRARQASEIAPAEVGSLDRRGTSVTMIVNPTFSLYTPFFHSSRGYGVYVEGTMPGTYDLAQSAADVVSIDFELSVRTKEFAVVYFVGDHDTILDEYTRLTGRPFVPPQWGFKHIRWRDEHAIGNPATLDGVAMNAQFVEDVTMYEQLGIPIGSYEFDRPWTSGTTDRGQDGFTSFTFDPTRFPNSTDMLAALHRRGYHVFVFGAPWALGDNAVDAQQFGYYAPRNNILIDFTNPDAVSWWQGHIRGLADGGIDGMKLDRAELVPTTTELVDMPDRVTDIWFDGRNGREMKNDYARLFAQIHHDAFAQERGGDFLNYLRAGYAGSQHYGVFWGGDTPGKDSFGLGNSTDLGLRSAILGLNHVAFMGFPFWGTDTGGYYEFGDREVFARWLEFSAFCPIMEIGGSGTHAPWNMPTQPTYDAEMIEIYRRYVTLHHELLPLTYSLALDAGASGRPLARPLVFDFADDPNVADLWDEFMFGHDLLIAPLWKSGARDRDVYFPRGTWIDVTDPNRQFTGPIHASIDAPLDHLPMFARAGALVPLDVDSDVTGNGSAASAGRLTIDAYPSGMSSFTLRDAVGQTTLTLAGSDCGAGTCVQLRIGPSQRSYIVRLLMSQPTGVKVDDQTLTAVGTFAAWEGLDTGWFYDVSGGRLWVKFATTGAATELSAGS